MNAKALRQIAKEVRTWVEDHRTNTVGKCAECSLRVFKKIVRAGGKPVFCVYEGQRITHCFVVCSGYNVDVTSDQFGHRYPKILVRKHVNKSPWKITAVAKTVFEISVLVGDWS